MTLRYTPHNHIPLAKNLDEVLRHLHRLWGFTVRLEQVADSGHTEILATCPPKTAD